MEKLVTDVLKDVGIIAGCGLILAGVYYLGCCHGYRQGTQTKAEITRQTRQRNQQAVRYSLVRCNNN